MRALSVPFRVRGGVVATEDYEEIVRGQVIDAVATNAGERLMNPTWGCNLRDRVFDPSDSLVRSDVAGQIRRKLPNFVPRAVVTGVDLAIDDNQPNLVRVNVGYKASSYSPEVNVSVPVDTPGTDLSSGSDTSV